MLTDPRLHLPCRELSHIPVTAKGTGFPRRGPARGGRTFVDFAVSRPEHARAHAEASGGLYILTMMNRISSLRTTVQGVRLNVHALFIHFVLTPKSLKCSYVLTPLSGAVCTVCQHPCWRLFTHALTPLSMSVHTSFSPNFFALRAWNPQISSRSAHRKPNFLRAPRKRCTSDQHLIFGWNR